MKAKYNSKRIEIPTHEEVAKLFGQKKFRIHDNLKAEEMIRFYSNQIYDVYFDEQVYAKRSNIRTKYHCLCSQISDMLATTFCKRYFTKLKFK